METFIANLTGKTRRATRNGRKYIVASVSMIKPRVLNGSQGPLYYPADEIAAAADAWNGLPLVVYHPVLNGSPVSARNPEVLDKQGIGTVFNSKDDGTAEAWFDEEATERVDNRVLLALIANKPIEVSTGLHTKNEVAPEGSEFEGTPYTHIARNYKPDHLAILPDGIGACSLEDGCGILANTAVLVGFIGRTDKHVHQVTLDDKGFGIAHLTNLHTHLVREFVVEKNEGHTHALSKSALVDSGVRNNQSNKKESGMTDAERKKVVDGLIANECCWEEEDRETLNALSDGQLNRVQEQNKKQEQQLITVNSKNEEYATALKKGVTDPGGNTHTWNEKTSKWDMKPKEKEKGPVINKIDKPLTEEEYLAQAPESIREDLAYARNAKREQKEALVKKIVANVKDEQEQARLTDNFMKKSLEDLNDMVSLIPQPKQTVNYASAAGGPAASVANQEENFADFGLPEEYIPEEKKD